MNTNLVQAYQLGREAMEGPRVTAENAIGDVWGWINRNAGGLTFFATIGGVAVAAIYARLTHRLAGAAERQTRTATDEITVLREQAEATAVQARATREQAATTQKMFEAGNRPSLSIASKFEPFGESVIVDRSLVIRVMNHGSVAARVERVEFERKDTYAYPTECPFHVFPGASVVAGHLSVFGAQPVKVKNRITVTYSGLAESPYQTVATVSAEEVLSYTNLGDVSVCTTIEAAN